MRLETKQAKGRGSTKTRVIIFWRGIREGLTEKEVERKTG